MRLWLFLILSLLLFSAKAQFLPPSLQWQRSIGGTLEDQGYDIQSTPDGGFITAGVSSSSDGDISLNKGRTDGWIIKYNQAGNIEWQKTYGGSYDDVLLRIEVLNGGGYIATGYTTSNDGDVSGLHGGDDIWFMRLDNAGNILWQKCYGGSLNEFPETILQTAAGGFIIFGHTTSTDGDVIGLHPGIGHLGDVWIVNIDGAGNILWQRCYGGSDGESAGKIEQTPDGGYIFTSYSSSNDGDVSGNLNGDFWLVRLNSSGNIIWQKCFGGTAGETPYGMVQVADGYVLAGISLSIGGLNQNHGNGDVWVLKTDFNGTLLWQKFYGGTGFETANTIIRARDGGFFIAGITESSDGNSCKNFGEEDYWILKLNSTGNLEWQKSLGGTKRDKAFGIIEANDGSLYINGSSVSNDNDVTGNHGFSDLWLIKLSFSGTSFVAGVNITSSDNNVCPGKNIRFTATPVNGGTNPSYHWYINKAEQITANGNVFNSTTLKDGDLVSCKLISNLICIDMAEAESNSKKITLDTTGRPSGFLPAELAICEGVPQQLSSSQSFPSYLWSTGATTASITVTTIGNYWLEVPYGSSCKSRVDIKIVPKKCNQQFYLPSAFTPNNDGKNDLLKPVIYGFVRDYNLTIYNRWGEMILNTKDPNKGWDGKLNGKYQDSNIYIWVCTYRLSGESLKTEKGTVMIIR
jgi:gliding motility-associated-like protein